MRIGAVFQPYADFSKDYAAYRGREIPQVDTEEVKRQDRLSEKTAEQLAPTSAAAASEPSEDQPSKPVDLENISLSFNKNDFGYIGRESSLIRLDVQKAISDMKKDSVLEEYQYFVGSANVMQGIQTGTDGTVIPKTAL